jgi:hypothetical protein
MDLTIIALATKVLYLASVARARTCNEMTSSQHIYEVRPRKDKRGFDLISDALAFFFPELRSAVFRRTSWNGSTSLLPKKRKRFCTTTRR